MRRALALSLGLLACGAHAVPEVHVSVLPVVAAPQGVDMTLLGECTIVGAGERRTFDGSGEFVDFDVFATREARAPALVIARPQVVHVAWSHFPSFGDSRGRARVGLGQQKHVRFEGYSSLHGRTFSAKKKMFAEPGHLWARAGAPVEMVAAEANVAVARVTTPFVAPTALVVRGPCDEVAYDPDVPELAPPPNRKSIATGTNRGKSLALFAAPTGQPFTTLTFEDEDTIELDVMDRRDAFVRVVGEKGEVGLDAWARASEVDEDAVAGMSMSGFGTSGCGGSYSSEHGVLVRDAPLFVGASPVALAGAFVEKDAEVRYHSSDEQTLNGSVFVAFEFEDNVIRAPDDERFWVAKDAVARR